MIRCQEIVEQVTEFLGDGLEPADRVRFEQHLLVCPPCTRHVGQVKATIGLVGGLRLAAPATEVGPGLLDLFRKRKPTS